jgi:hypothetical protein
MTSTLAINIPSTIPPPIAIANPIANLHILVAIPYNKLPSAAPYAKSSATSYGDGKILSGQIPAIAIICQTAITMIHLQKF